MSLQDDVSAAFRECVGLREACAPILEALRKSEPFECTDPDWNLDAHIEITVTVREARALAKAMKPST